MLACTSSPIIHDRLGQHTNERGLTRVHIADHCDTGVILRTQLQLAVHLLQRLLEILRLRYLIDLVGDLDELNVARLKLNDLIFGLFLLVFIHDSETLSKVCIIALRLCKALIICVDCGLFRIVCGGLWVLVCSEALLVLELDLVEHVLEGLGAAWLLELGFVLGYTRLNLWLSWLHFY